MLLLAVSSRPATASDDGVHKRSCRSHRSDRIRPIPAAVAPVIVSTNELARGCNHCRYRLGPNPYRDVLFGHVHARRLMSAFHPKRPFEFNHCGQPIKCSNAGPCRFIFTAPSTSFPGATISVECSRIYDGEKYIEGTWATNVFAANGGWVEHEGSDNVQLTMDAFISTLSAFYDGSAIWIDDDTGEQLGFWEMTLRTLPESLGPPAKPA